MPLEAQLAGLRVDEAVEAAVVRAIGRPVERVAADYPDLERRRHQLALDLANGRIGDRAFLAAARRLREEEAAASDEPRVRQAVDAARALDYIRNFAAAWSRAKPATRAGMIQAVYQTVTVRGDQFVNVRLTDEAYAHGFAAALPQEVSVPALASRGRPRKLWALARPTVSEFRT